MTIINNEAMKTEELRKILKGKCISDESCEAAIIELLDLFNVRLSYLTDDWFNKQVEYERIASEKEDARHAARFNGKSQATRDCWKELQRIIEDEA